MKLLLLSLCLALAFAQQCNLDEYSLNTRDFLNELGDLIEKQYAKVKVGGMGYLQEINRNLTRSFNEGGCGQQWDSNYTPQRRSQWLWQYLAQFRTRSGKPVSQKIVNLAKQIEEYIWKIGADHIFATCVATKVRDNIIEWMANSCLRGQVFRVIKQGLNDFPIAQYAGNQAYEQDLRAALVLLAEAYLASTKCGSVADTQRVVQAINKRTEEDFCWAASDTFIKDSCYNQYKSNCPRVHGCVNNLVDNFNSVSKEIFGDQGEVVKDAKDCIRKSNDEWGGNKPSFVPGTGTVLAEGLKLWREVKAVKDSLTQEERDEVAMYAKAVVKAHFRTEACDCENVNR